MYPHIVNKICYNSFDVFPSTQFVITTIAPPSQDEGDNGHTQTITKYNNMCNRSKLYKLKKLM